METAGAPTRGVRFPRPGSNWFPSRLRCLRQLFYWTAGWPVSPSVLLTDERETACIPPACKRSKQNGFVTVRNVNVISFLIPSSKRFFHEVPKVNNTVGSLYFRLFSHLRFIDTKSHLKDSKKSSWFIGFEYNHMIYYHSGSQNLFHLTCILKYSIERYRSYDPRTLKIMELRHRVSYIRSSWSLQIFSR